MWSEGDLSLQVEGTVGAGNVWAMSDTEPGWAHPGPSGPPPRPPGPVPAGYVPREWLQQAPPPPAQARRAGAWAGGPGVAAPGLPPVVPAEQAQLPPPNVPFLDTPWVPPQTKRQGWMWLLYAVIGFVVGQIGAVVCAGIAAAATGHTSDLRTITTEAVPPEWYVVSTLLGLWVGFVGGPWLASRTQGTRNFVRDLGLRFRLIDLVGIAIGVGGQLLVAVMYAPFQRHIHNFNGPTHRLTGGSHGAGFFVIAVATVVFAPAMEELFFRGLVLKGLVRVCTPLGAVGRGRAVAVVVAVVLDGLLFGLAHGEWVQLAGLASFGIVLAAISYRTGRQGMNMVAHASFNLVAILAVAFSPSGLLH